MCASATTMNKRKQDGHDDDCDANGDYCDVNDNDHDVSRKTENKQNINLESNSRCVKDVPWYSWGVCVHGDNEARIILHYVQ